MRLITTLLWKEWRDHRAALVGYFVGVPALIAWGLAALPAAKRTEASLPAWAALCGFAIAALTLFGDLFAGEEQRGTIRLLRRLPGGLARVFAAKLAFALLAAAAMSGWAYLASSVLAAGIWGGRWWPRLAGPGLGIAVLLLPLAAWIVPAAIWLPRATLALPAAALTLALFGAPIAAAFWMQPGMQPTPDEVRATAIGIALAAPLAAGVSFVFGRRRARRAWVPAALGLAATLACFTPAYAWTGVRVARFLAIEPGAASFRFDPRSDASISPDGRYAYVVGFHLSVERAAAGGVIGRESDRGDGPGHPLAIDLEAGTWRSVGPAGSGFWSPSICNGLGLRTPTPRIALIAPTVFSGAIKDRSARFELIATETSRVVREGLLDDALSQELMGTQERWPHGALPLPDGRRWHVERGRLVVDPGRELPDGEVKGPHAWWRLEPRGFGCWVGPGSGGYGEYYDFLREKRYSRSASDSVLRWIGRTSWVVWRPQRTRDAGISRYERFDPDTEESAPIAGFSLRDDLLELEVGGLFLADRRGPTEPEASPNDAPRWLEWLDVDTGAATPIEPVEALDLRRAWIRAAGRLPSGRLIVRIEMPHEGRVRFGRAVETERGARLELTPVLEAAELLGAAEEESLVVIDAGRRLVRVSFDATPPETLFPR